MVSSFLFPIVRTCNKTTFIASSFKCSSNDKVIKHGKIKENKHKIELGRKEQNKMFFFYCSTSEKSYYKS